jgi:hypothetical protein
MTPIKTIARMHRVFDAPRFESRYNVDRTTARRSGSCATRNTTWLWQFGFLLNALHIG